MKRIFTVFAVICMVVFLCPMVALAGPIGGLGYNFGQDRFSFAIAGSVSYGQRDVNLVSDSDIENQLRSWNFLSKISVAPIKYVDIYGLIGVADMQFEDGGYKGPLNTAYGGGIRPMLFPLVWDSQLNICLDGQYLGSETSDGDVWAKMHNLHGALIFAYLFNSFTPYGGLKYDYLFVEMKGDSTNMESKIEIAVFAGCDIFVTPNVFFNAEVSLFSETRVAAGVGYKY